MKKPVSLQIDENLLAGIDMARGSMSRNAWFVKAATALMEQPARPVQDRTAGRIVRAPGSREHLPICKCPICVPTKSAA